MHLITKSEFMRGRSCLGDLWYSLRHPQETPALDPLAQDTIAQGFAVEEQAEALFPRLTLLPVTSVEGGLKLTATALPSLRKEVASGGATLSQGTFSSGPYASRCDFLQLQPSGV